MESLGNTSKLIHNTWASDLCKNRLALLHYSFSFTPYIFCMLGGYLYLVFMVENKLVHLTLNCSSICLR